MKNSLQLLLTVLMMVVGGSAIGQILTFEFSALAGNEATANSNSNNANLSSSTISRGAGLTASANGGRFNATSWALTSIANAVSGDDYMEFTITPNSGYQFSVSSIVVQWQRSNTGNIAIALRSSVDNYATDLDAVKAVVDNDLTQTFTWTFAQANSSNAVTYRFYSYAEALTGTGGPGDGTGNDITVNGTVTAGCTPPTNHATTFSTNNIQQNQMNVTWVRGSGDSVLVVARSGGAVNSDPLFGTNYNANAAFGSGTQIGTGNFVVYKGLGTTESITALTANTTYHYAIYEFSGMGGSQCYKTIGKLTGSATTLPIPPIITHTGTSPVASNIAQGSTNNILYQLAVATVDNAATLTEVVITTNGSWDADDLDNFKLRFSTDNILDINDATLDTETALSGGTQNITFNLFSQNIPIGTRYLFVTCDVDASATVNNTIAAGPDADADFTYTENESYSGSTFATANAKTIIGIPEIQLEYPVASNVNCGFTLPFGNVVVNDSSSLTVRIRNTGTADLTLSPLPTIGGGNANQFSITTPPTSPIAAGSFSDMVVRFLPTTTGAKTTTISIANNDNNENPCSINLTGTGTLANDNCSGAISLTVDPDESCGAVTNGTSIGGTQSIAAISCGLTGNADDDVWYSFVATGTSHIITVDGASNMDVVIDLRSGACNGTNIACADLTATDGIEVLTATGLTNGATYYIRVYDFAGSGDFTICVTTPEPPLHYRTKNSGLWSAVGTWETSPNNMNPWIDAIVPPNSDELSVTILSPHVVTINANVTIDQVVIASGSTIDVTGGTLLTVANGDSDDLLVQGILKNSTSSTFTLNGGATIVIDNGGKYQHNPSAAGSFTPMTWNSGSTCEVLRASSMPSGTINQSYHHFIWNSANHGATTINLTSQLKTINGDFSIQNTGTGALRLASSTNTLDVAGNLSLSPGTELDLGNGSGTSIVNVNGNVTNAGTIELMGGTPQNGYLNIKGSLSGNGTITETGGDDCRVKFNGTTTQSAAFGTVTNRVNVEIDNGQGVSLASSLTITSSAALIFTNGNLILNDNVLNMVSSGTTITGASSAKYIQTNGTGVLQRSVSNSPVTFPIGNSTYNPIILTRTVGTGHSFSSRVLDGVFADGLSGLAVTDKVVNRTWDILLVAGSVGTLTLTAQWNSGEEIGGFDRTLSYLSHYTGGVWVSDTPAAASGGNPYTRTRTGITSLSPFAMGSQGSPLPIELTRFDATLLEKQVALTWTTATEINNEYFLVQHSVDGRNYTDIGMILGAGTTTQAQSYSYQHETPTRGANYYRLQQVDYDGAFSFSPVRVVELGGGISNTADNWSIRPTIASDQINLLRQGAAGAATWTVFTMEGRPALRGQFPADSDVQAIDISALHSGPYFLQVISREGVWSGRIVRE
jgi:hypothetical protein